jgi:hypothetical protein
VREDREVENLCPIEASGPPEHAKLELRRNSLYKTREHGVLSSGGRPKCTGDLRGATLTTLAAVLGCN